MKRTGIIGVGGIARAIVGGLCGGGEEPPEIFLSPRGARTATELSQRYPSVRVCADNQDVLDRSQLVFIAVRPDQYAEALTGLRVGSGRVVVNVMAGVGTAELRQVLDTDTALVRAMPQQAVQERQSVTVTCPSHPDVDALFDYLGGVLPVADEGVFDVFCALTATVSTHFAYLAAVVAWAERQGIPSENADHFIRNLFQGVGRQLGEETRSLPQLRAEHETPNGANERIRITWFESASPALGKALDELLVDLKANRLGLDGSVPE